MNDPLKQKNLAELLEMEDLLNDSARFRQWQEDVKGVLHIDNGDKDIINKTSIKDNYIQEHIHMNKEELLYRLEILDEILEYLK